MYINANQEVGRFNYLSPNKVNMKTQWLFGCIFILCKYNYLKIANELAAVLVLVLNFKRVFESSVT